MDGMIRYEDAIVEVGLDKTAIVVAKTANGKQRVIAEIIPVPTQLKPYRVCIKFPDGEEALSANLGTAAARIARRKGLSEIRVIRGTAQHLYSR